ncbi:Nn.00g018760.m01.CDS01 [Neocucurbitaria sp. VM-36]
MAAATPAEMETWPPPNFENPENRHALVIALCAPTLCLAVLFLSVRFYGKGLLRQILGLDDYVMLAAMIFALPVSILPLVSLNLGLGIHIWDQKPEWHTPYSKMGYVADILFPIACSLTKISLCLTYLRLFPNRSTKIFCYVMSTFVTMYTVACVFLSIFQCRPIRGYWDINVKQDCINMRVELVIIASLNSFSDFVIYLWPAKPLWSLQLPLKQRLGLIFLFSVGLVVCIAGILRMYFLEVYFRSYDALWNGAPIWSTMILEMDVGIICGCLSGVKPVMAVVFPNLFGSSYKTRSGPTRLTYGQTGRSTRRESFAFHPLSDVSYKSRDQKIENMPIDAITKSDGKEQRNFVWASSSGNLDVASSIPANKIRVQQVVTVEQEESGSITPRSERDIKVSDAGSEEWIMDDRPKPHKSR